MSRNAGISLSTIERLRSEGATHLEIAEKTGVSRQGITKRLKSNLTRIKRENGKRQSAIKAKLAGLPPCKYGTVVYDRSGEKQFVVGPSPKFGMWRVRGEGFCDCHDVSVLELFEIPPAKPEDEEIGKRLAGFTRSTEGVSLLSAPTEKELAGLSDEDRQGLIAAVAEGRAVLLSRKQLIEHAMKLAVITEPATVKSRRSNARSGADPDTNLRATQEQRSDDRKNHGGLGMDLFIQHDKRLRDTGRKTGRNALRGKHPMRLPGEFACPNCSSTNSWSKAKSRNGSRRRVCKDRNKAWTVGEQAAEKGGAQ